MHLGVYTIEKTLFEGEVQKIIAKTTTGEISVLPDHIPLISKLVKSVLRVIDTSGAEKDITIDSGFIEVQPENKVTVLVDTDTV